MLLRAIESSLPPMVQCLRVLRGWDGTREGSRGEMRIGEAFARGLLFVFHMRNVNDLTLIQDLVSNADLETIWSKNRAANMIEFFHLWMKHLHV